MAHWHFRPRRPDDTTRDPISGEFFSTEAIRDSAEALVREGIQNSLDARAQAGGRVRVRLFLSGDAGASAASIAPLLGGLGAHLMARGNGLREDQRPDLTRACRFLVFEDFGTKGLCGDPLQWHHVDDVSNAFFAFFRAEGESDKSASDRRGRWGVGKFVFPRASSASTFFGLTVQADSGRTLLMGRTVLKSHQVGQTYFVPDGYFGREEPLPEGPIIAPVENDNMLTTFREVFRLKRGTLPGLSLVVPWYDPEITRERLVEAVVRDWFYSILAAELEVEVADSRGSITLTAASIREELASLPDALRKEIEPLLNLTSFALSEPGRNPVTLAVAGSEGAPRWESDLLGENDVTLLKAGLAAERPLAVRFRCMVRLKGHPPRESSFDAFLVRDQQAETGQPVFVREGIIVSDAKGGRSSGLRSLVVCNEGALADLLGDAENPSHTEWRPDTANFKNRYVNGPTTLTFVKQAVRSLVLFLQESEDDSDPDLLRDLFSLPIPVEPDRPRRPEQDDEGDDRQPPPDSMPARLPRYRISRTAGGFSVARGADGASVPAELIVEVAYAVRRGNPFRRYDRADFELIRQPLRLSAQPRGLTSLSAEGNRLQLQVTDPDFHISVDGFDTNRDLAVRVTATDPK